MKELSFAINDTFEPDVVQYISVQTFTEDEYIDLFIAWLRNGFHLDSLASEREGFEYLLDRITDNIVAASRSFGKGLQKDDFYWQLSEETEKIFDREFAENLNKE